MIRPVFDHYDQFQNGRRKIQGFSRNVLMNMVFLIFASQARFECLILHFIARSSIYKCWDVIFKTQSKMAARNDPGILILITMPIPDRVRASLLLIHYMLNSRQVRTDASSVLQNIMGVYYSAIW